MLQRGRLFLLVFGIQEGATYDWGTITGPITVWGLIIAGIVVLAAFVVWQRFNRNEPLLPLRLFHDRNFSLANVAITTVGFSITGDDASRSCSTPRSCAGSARPSRPCCWCRWR